MSNDATMATKVIRLITDRPGSFAVEISDQLNMDLGFTEACLLDLVSLGQITSHMTKAPNGVAGRAYTIAGVELPTIKEKPTAAASRTDGKPQTHCEKAVAFIAANGGSATSAELHSVLGLKLSEYASSYLAVGVRQGKINKDGQNWTLGKAAPVVVKAGVFNETINIAKANASKVAARAPVEKVGQAVHVISGHCGVGPLAASLVRDAEDIRVSSHVDAPSEGDRLVNIVRDAMNNLAPVRPKSPAPDTPELSFAYWSTGEFHIASDGEVIMVMSACELEVMCKYLRGCTIPA